MTETSQDPEPEQSTSAVRPSWYRTSPRSRGSRRSGPALAGGGDLPLRPQPAARERLLHRHSAADGQRQAARRARVLLHPHRPGRALPADERQGRLLPDGLGRQRAAHRAPGAELLRRPLRPEPALRRRLHAAGEPRPEEADPDQPAQLRRAVRALVVELDEKVFEQLWRTLGLSVDWNEHYTTIGPKSQLVSQTAFLRNFARGEAYLQEAPTLWDVTFQTAVAQAELEAREYAGSLPPGRLPPRRRQTVYIETTRPELIASRGRADRAPRRRALPAAVRHHGRLPRLRRRDPGPGPPCRGDGQGRRHRHVLHVRRPHRRHLVARAPPAGPHRDRPRRPVAPRDARVAGARGAAAAYADLAGKTVFSAREAMVAKLRETGDLDGEPTPTQRMANFYERGEKPLEIVATRQWYIRNGGRDAALREPRCSRAAPRSTGSRRT